MSEKKQIVVLGACMPSGVGKALVESLKNTVEILPAKEINPLTIFDVQNARRDVRDPRRSFKSVNKQVRRVNRGRGR